MAKPPANFKHASFARPHGFGPTPLGEIVPELLDPVLQKRAGLNTALIGAWAEIAGPHLAQVTRPQKTVWGRADAALDGSGAATLVIAADPSVALRIQHETGALLLRINTFFGYRAIDRLRIVQMPIAETKSGPSRPAPDQADTARARTMASGVENEALRDALSRLGAHVLASAKRGM
jgi:hypothetical protein